MYAETGLMFPYFQSFEAQQVQHYDEFICDVENPNNASLGAPGSLVETSTISDYNLGGEGELFNAPEPIIGDPLMGFDSMVNIESSIEREELLDEVFYACRNDILEKEGKYETPLSEVLSIKVPAVNIYQDFIAESPLQKSISSSNLSLMEGVDEAPPRKYVQDFPVMDFGEAYGMRRAFSEGDLKNFGSGSMSLVPSPAAQSKMTGCYTSEVRMQKLSRYRSKKSKRNFGRKIKYACRKALADSQPRVRGRFAKTD